MPQTRVTTYRGPRLGCHDVASASDLSPRVELFAGGLYDRAMQTIRRLVFIVAPGNRQLFESLTRTFAGDSTVQVVLDRRGTERRQKGEPQSSDRRRTDRRLTRQAQKKLSQRGYTVVGVVAAKTTSR